MLKKNNLVSTFKFKLFWLPMGYPVYRKMNVFSFREYLMHNILSGLITY